MPAYNAEALISETITSVINQTYANWELLILDDLSTDNTIAIVKEFADKDQRIKLIRSTVNIGQGARRNIGINLAKGDIISFLDSDDIWQPNKLSHQIPYLDKFDLVASNFYYFTNSESLRRKVIPILHPRFFNKLFVEHPRLIYYYCFFACSSILIKKDILSKARFKEEKEYRAIEDISLWIELIIKQKIKYTISEYPDVAIRLSSGSSSYNKFNQLKKRKEMLKSFGIKTWESYFSMGVFLCIHFFKWTIFKLPQKN